MMDDAFICFTKFALAVFDAEMNSNLTNADENHSQCETDDNLDTSFSFFPTINKVVFLSI